MSWRPESRFANPDAPLVRPESRRLQGTVAGRKGDCPLAFQTAQVMDAGNRTEFLF